VAVLIGEAGAIDACERLIGLNGWPSSKIDPNGWLQNFEQADRCFAAHMLGRFMLFSDELVDALFLSAFQSLSNIIRQGWRHRLEANRLWNSFLNRAYITIVQGETPNPSDSGFLFARKARQVLGMPEDQLLAPNDALKAVADGFDGPIIFVDDFAGSGEQFLSTWKRKRDIPGHGQIAFKDMPKRADQLIVYCNSILTEFGRDRITADYPEILLVTGNVIPRSYSWTHDTSVLWPADERRLGTAFIKRVSEAIGFGDDNGGEQDWQGFNKLGLGFAFEHSTPDATLPIFHCNQNWRPLVRRS